MKQLLTVMVAGALTACGSLISNAQLLNGSLDETYQQEIVPGFFLPKPAGWVNEGFRAITGPYEDELSSEPWAGPAPTPDTNPGDFGVFFKAFSGNTSDGPATANLFQDTAATPGLTYMLTGWAGAEANYLATRSLFAIDFLDLGNNVIGSTELDLVAAGLFVGNGQPFNYKAYTVMATAPANAVSVRARVSMIGGSGNPLGGGQAFVVDDFALVAVPEPTSIALVLMGLLGLLGVRARKGGSR
jgi:hypothetical protein